MEARMSGDQPAVLGIDFGTTNTVVAVADADGQARLVRFAMPLGAAASAFRSVLSFQEGEEAGRLAVEAGPGRSRRSWRSRATPG
jgi:hypothetical chaperone protein